LAVENILKRFVVKVSAIAQLAAGAALTPGARTVATERVMQDSVELRAQELSVSATPPDCLKCKGDILLAAMISDVRRSLIVRVYQCECGELLWDEKPPIRIS